MSDFDDAIAKVSQDVQDILSGAAIKKQYAAWLLKPGLNFTPEHQAKMKALIAEGKIAEAQKIILDELQRAFDGQDQGETANTPSEGYE